MSQPDEDTRLLPRPPLKTTRRRFEVKGVVQGVGFRPFVYNLAIEHSLTGTVFNHSAGVTIEAEGENLAVFEHQLTTHKPPLAVIDELTSTEIPLTHDATFRILESEHHDSASTPAPPDIATCPDCLRELLDPHDRRYHYPFLNCTNCGPRFTIIKDLPYDRPATTMSVFPMCPACEAEYHDPANRRFHAQPTACPTCGPQLSDSAAHIKQLLAESKIVAVKGIGGFHLVCDATSDTALSNLRERKHRFEQPFAVMAKDLEVAREIAEVSPEEAALLESPQRPIVLLRKRDSALSNLVAPGNGYLGVMLPYAPLHYLLLDENPLVMTSANPSGEPIVRENAEALERLSTIADAFLTHNRDIEVVCDDSVIRTFEGHEMPLRRSRGYAPMPVNLPHEVPEILAVGAELKATFCITKGHFAYLSQHIGDMGTIETQRAFERALDHMLRLFRVDPHQVACDLHPGYRSSQWAEKYARERQLPLQKVQHHHAHIAALIAESGRPLDTPIIGIAFDGTGYGTDGAIWGGEVLITRGNQFDRFLHLRYVPLAGGDATIKYPIRSALSHLYAAGLRHNLGLDAILHQQIERNINCVPSSSMGRLFDAVSALIGLRRQVTYEGQAAIELESIATRSNRAYPAEIRDGVFDPTPLLAAILEDLKAGIPREEIAAAFHSAVATWIVKASQLARDKTGLNLVGLTGGVFQNLTLLAEAVSRLRSDGFEVLVHRKVPANDGGLALGQAAVVAVGASLHASA